MGFLCDLMGLLGDAASPMGCSLFSYGIKFVFLWDAAFPME